MDVYILEECKNPTIRHKIRHVNSEGGNDNPGPKWYSESFRTRREWGPHIGATVGPSGSLQFSYLINWLVSVQ